MVGPSDAPPQRGGHQGRPGDGDRVATAMAYASAPGDAANAGGRRSALARSASTLLPVEPGLPGSGPEPGGAALGALQRPPGARDVARRERVRLPRGGLLLRRFSNRFPHLAADAVRLARRAQPGLGNGLLVAALFGLGGDPAAPPGADLAQSGPVPGLPTVQLGRSSRLLRDRADGALESHTRHPDHDQLHAVFQTPRLLEVGGAGGHRQRRRLPGSQRAGGVQP